MNLIFLDIDGVLNSRNYITKMGDLWDDPKYQMDPAAVARLNRITDATGASIVIISTWRLAFTHCLDKLQACMASYGITGQVIGMTPDLVAMQGSLYVARATRGGEVDQWMFDNTMPMAKDNIVILDDETVDGWQDVHIKTNFDDGLQDSHVDRAIALLGGLK
jgi:hypothetical protein